MKYTQIHKIEEYNGTTFLGEDLFQVFSDHFKWVEEKKRYIIRELYNGNGEIMDWVYKPIHENDPILYNHIFYFRPLSNYGAVLLRNLIYELIPGLIIRNSINIFLSDRWYKVMPHYICYETYTSDYSMIYEYPRGSKEYNEIDECDAHALSNISKIKEVINK